MPLIKSNNVPPGAASFSMRDIENHARTILMRAREQAEGLIGEAQKEAEGLKSQGYAEGLEEGRREGRAQGELEGAQAGAQQALAEHQEQLATLIAALSTASVELDAARRDLEADALREVVNLSVGIARRVTKRQGILDPQVLTDNLREAMQLVAHAADVRIAIHPAQKTVLEAALPALRMAWPQLKHVELIDDPKLSPGGCRIFTVRGMVDADLNAQLDRVVADLLPSTQEGGMA
jgi:flagellar assembly protein FliH